MPNPVMFSNKTALKNAVERLDWKIKATGELLSEKFGAPEFLKGKIDRRNIHNLIPLLVDISAYDNRPEEEKMEYFKKEAEKIAADFYLTHDEDDPLMPNFKAVEPHLRRMYDEMKVDNNIDWDNEREIETLYSGLYLQQSWGTVASDFAGYFAKTMSEQERRELDTKCLKAYANSNLLMVATRKENLDLAKKANCGTVDTANRQYFVDQEVAIAVADASKDGSEPVVFDPAASNMTKNYFLGHRFVMDQTGEVNEKDTYDEIDARENFYNALTDIPGKGCFDNALTSAAMGRQSKADLIMINGQPVGDIYKKAIDDGLSDVEASAKAGLAIRNALTDGKSIVTLMRPMLTEDGKITFKHQQMKVDLDKLNKIDRKETKYSSFRKFLDSIRLWKIQRFPTNKARDKAQAKKMETPAMKDALKKAEDKFIEQYNIKAQNPNNVNILNTFPKISRLENVEEKNLEVNKTQQVDSRKPLKIDPKEIDGNVKMENELPKDNPTKMLDNSKAV